MQSHIEIHTSFLPAKLHAVWLASLLQSYYGTCNVHWTALRAVAFGCCQAFLLDGEDGLPAVADPKYM